EPTALLSKRGATPASVRCPALERRDCFTVLYLCSPHPNKRVHLMGPIVAALRRRGWRCRLVTTMPDDSPYFAHVRKSFEHAGEADSLLNLGTIDPAEIGDVLCRVDAVVNISLLE